MLQCIPGRAADKVALERSEWPSLVPMLKCSGASWAAALAGNAGKDRLTSTCVTGKLFILNYLASYANIAMDKPFCAHACAQPWLDDIDMPTPLSC